MNFTRAISLSQSLKVPIIIFMEAGRSPPCILVSSQVRTENPLEANLFFVPILNLYRYQRRTNHFHVFQTMQYIQQLYPLLWNRHQGKDCIYRRGCGLCAECSPLRTEGRGALFTSSPLSSPLGTLSSPLSSPLGTPVQGETTSCG